MMEDEIIFQKLGRFCRYRERCHIEVKLKLAALKVYGARQEEMVARLIEEGLLNEQRYALAYASGKFRINRWGKYKIKQALQQKSISSYCIQKALSDIDMGEYWDVMEQVLDKRKREHPEDSFFELTAFMQGRGFELEMIKELLS